jgi:hypothetical protein
MTLPAFWFGPPPTLAENERWLLNLPANRTQGKRAVGGGLHVTNERVLFCPNVIDARLGGKPWSCQNSEITSIGIARRRFSLLELFSGGLADRLRFDLVDGAQELFVIKDPTRRASELCAMLHVPPASELPAMRVVE